MVHRFKRGSYLLNARKYSSRTVTWRSWSCWKLFSLSLSYMRTNVLVMVCFSYHVASPCINCKPTIVSGTNFDICPMVDLALLAALRHVAIFKAWFHKRPVVDSYFLDILWSHRRSAEFSTSTVQIFFDVFPFFPYFVPASRLLFRLIKVDLLTSIITLLNVDWCLVAYRSGLQKLYWSGWNSFYRFWTKCWKVIMQLSESLQLGRT